MRLVSRTRSPLSSSWVRVHSRSSTTTGAHACTRRRHCGSVRSAEASTRASRRSSLAPAGEYRSRNRSSCFGLIARTARPCASKLSTTGPRGVSIAHPHRLGRRRGNRLGDPRRHRRQPRPAVRETRSRHAPRQRRRARTPGGSAHPSPRRRTSSIPTSCSSSSLFLPMLQACRDAHLSLYWRSRRGLFTGRPSRQKTAGARVLRRCSWHRGRVVAPAALPSFAAVPRNCSKAYRGTSPTSVLVAQGTGGRSRQLCPASRRCHETVQKRTGDGRAPLYGVPYRDSCASHGAARGV